MSQRRETPSIGPRGSGLGIGFAAATPIYPWKGYRVMTPSIRVRSRTLTLLPFLGAPNRGLAVRRFTICLFSIALTGCASSQPIVVPEKISVPTYIPTPGTLTAPVKVTLQPGVTWGEAVGSLYSGLQTCNAQLSSISTLKPPEKPY